MLLAPLALILSLLAVPIILMYVLKLRRQERVVPSTFLWRRALEDVQANAPWQRLRFNILLLLQLLALAALVLALARPAYSRSHVLAGDLVVIVDASYGMQAHDVAPVPPRPGSRFDVALARARGLASDLGSGHVMSVIGMSAQPHLAIAESSDQSAIVRAIDTLHAGIDQPNFLTALSLAASLARAGQSTRVVVLTSRDSGIATLPVPVSFPVDIVRIGGQLHDLGITAFSASQRGSTAVEAVARVSNFGSQTARSDLDLFVDGRLEDVRPLTVGAHQQQNLYWTDLPLEARRLEVHLTQPDNVNTDKTAWAVVPGAQTRRVLLVSSGDYFLETALQDDPSVQLSVMPTWAYTPAVQQSYDLVIFDGFLPPTLPIGSALLVAPPAGRLGALRFGRNVPAGPIDVSSGGSPSYGSVLKYVDLSDVHVAQARAVSLPGWLQTLATSKGHTVLAVGARGDARLGLVSFDLQRSDWPLRISFPITLENLLHYLAPGLALGQTDVTTGQAVQFFPPPATRELQVTRPAGGATYLGPPFPPFTDTSRPGLYTVKALVGNGTARRLLASSASFAVNFFPARPAPAPGASTVHLGPRSSAQASKALIASVPVSVTWAFELLALTILGAEWWIAFRGVRL